MHAGSGAACLCECLNENIFGLNFPEWRNHLRHQNIIQQEWTWCCEVASLETTNKPIQSDVFSVRPKTVARRRAVHLFEKSEFDISCGVVSPSGLLGLRWPSAMQDCCGVRFERNDSSVAVQRITYSHFMIRYMSQKAGTLVGDNRCRSCLECVICLCISLRNSLCSFVTVWIAAIAWSLIA